MVSLESSPILSIEAYLGVFIFSKIDFLKLRLSNFNELCEEICNFRSVADVMLASVSSQALEYLLNTIFKISKF